MDQHSHGQRNSRAAGTLDSGVICTGLAHVLKTVFCSARLRDSRIGRAWIAIREDETAAAAMGAPLMRTKTWAHAPGAFLGGVAGASHAPSPSGARPRGLRLHLPPLLPSPVALRGCGATWCHAYAPALPP